VGENPGGEDGPPLLGLASDTLPTTPLGRPRVRATDASSPGLGSKDLVLFLLPLGRPRPRFTDTAWEAATPAVVSTFSSFPNALFVAIAWQRREDNNGREVKDWGFAMAEEARKPLSAFCSLYDARERFLGCRDGTRRFHSRDALNGPRQLAVRPPRSRLKMHASNCTLRHVARRGMKPLREVPTEEVP
jgi:hypothetical protein